jgi:hypothetical protein
MGMLLLGVTLSFVLPGWILWDSKMRIGRVLWIGLVWAVVAFTVYQTYAAALVYLIYPQLENTWINAFLKQLPLLGGAYGFFSLYKFFTQEAAVRHAALGATPKDDDVAKV